MGKIEDLKERLDKLEEIKLQFCPKCNHNTLQWTIGCGYFQCTVCGSDLKRGMVKVELKENKGK